MSTQKQKRLLDEVREFMRLKQYSIHTERTYCEWIRRYVNYHQMQGREDLQGGEKKIERFLTHLAVNSNVSPVSHTEIGDADHFITFFF